MPEAIESERDQELKLPDPTSCNRECKFLALEENDPETGAPIVTIEISSEFAADLLIINSIPNRADGHFKYIGHPLPSRLKIPLREILGSHVVGGFGPMREIISAEVHRLIDVVSPYGSGIAYPKLIAAIYAQLLPFKEAALMEIPFPKAVQELIQHPEMFGKTNIDMVAKTISIDNFQIMTFPNPTYPRRIIEDIEKNSDWRVLFDHDGSHVLPIIREREAEMHQRIELDSLDDGDSDDGGWDLNKF